MPVFSNTECTVLNNINYDAVIEVTGVDDTAISSDSETSSSNGHAPAPPETIAPEASQLVCRCGQGGAKNKQTRTFCAQYKSGCKCFQNLKGCTSACGCYNCANTYGVRTGCPDEGPTGELQPRKRRKHGLAKETGKDFMNRRGEKLAANPWSLFEELLCIECALYMGGTEDINIDNLTDFYNKIVFVIKDGTLKFPQNFSNAVDLQTFDLKGRNSVEKLLTRLCTLNVVFEDAMRQQIELNVL